MPRCTNSSPMVSRRDMRFDLLACAHCGGRDILVMRHENLRYRGDFDALHRDTVCGAQVPHPPDSAVAGFPEFARAADIEFHRDLAAAEPPLELAAIRRRHRQAVQID